MAKTEKSLTQRFVDLIQVPGVMEVSYAGDVSRTGNVEPVRPSSKSYLPMTIELLPPKIELDINGAFNQNAELERSQSDVGFVGDNLVSSDGFFEMAEDIQFTLQTLDFIEPLMLYINPTDLTRTFGRRVQEQMAGHGHIEEHWGEEQDKLSCNGKIGATYTNKTGLTRYFRRNSASYQQLMHLFTIYRNNGYLFEVTDTNRISLVGAVQITYDTETWIGHFDTFSMSENADNPYTMEYSFEFTVREYFNDTSLSTS